MMNEDDCVELWLLLSSSDEDKGNSVTLDLETATTCIPGKVFGIRKVHPDNLPSSASSHEQSKVCPIALKSRLLRAPNGIKYQKK